MKLHEIMTRHPLWIHPKESVAVAARMLARHNIGVLPVCEADGRVCGLVTDRDLVTRCMAAGRSPERTAVREVMTSQLVTADPQMDTGVAAHLMGRKQVRRLPVVEDGVLQGIVSLGDLAVQPECSIDTADALSEITSNISDRRV